MLTYTFLSPFLQAKMDVLGEKYVVNLSRHTLTTEQNNILACGLNFCPTPGKPDPGELRSDLDLLHRRLRLESRFKGEEVDICDLQSDEENNHSSYPFAHRNFKPTSSYNPIGPPCLEAMTVANKLDYNNRGNFPSGLTNISPKEKEAIRELRDNNKIVIKPADKGSAVVILNREDYLAEGYKQLSDTNFYQKIEEDMTE